MVNAVVRDMSMALLSNLPRGVHFLKEQKTSLILRYSGMAHGRKSKSCSMLQHNENGCYQTKICPRLKPT